MRTGKTIHIWLVGEEDLLPGKLGRCAPHIGFADIFIREDLPRPVQYSILLHEIRHAMDDKVSNRELRALWGQTFFCAQGFLGACWVKFKGWVGRKGGGKGLNPLQVGV